MWSIVTPMAWVRDGHCLYLGPPPRGDFHSTATAQLVVGVDAPVVLQADGLPDIAVGSAVIPARTTHRVHALGDCVLLCYFDPAGNRSARDFASLRDMHGPMGIGHPREELLIDAVSHRAVDVDALLGLASLPDGRPIDSRIPLVAGLIRADPALAHRAAAHAADLGLSTSHFLRLFGEQTSTSYRRYIQWARIVHAATAVSRGCDFSRAASDAGFSSPSHFSDVFRAVFGVTLSSLVGSGLQFG
ncbi:helix-turn-helix transcriptional regulator [Nocardia sp. NPDC055321]